MTSPQRDAGRAGPGWLGGLGLLCMAVALGALLSVLPPIPTAAVWGLTLVGAVLLAVAAVRSWRSPA